MQDEAETKMDRQVSLALHHMREALGLDTSDAAAQQHSHLAQSFDDLPLATLRYHGTK